MPTQAAQLCYRNGSPAQCSLHIDHGLTLLDIRTITLKNRQPAEERGECLTQMALGRREIKLKESLGPQK